MDKLNYKLYKIVSPDFFDEIQLIYQQSYLVMPKLADNLVDAYEQIREIILPGIAEDGTMGAMLTIAATPMPSPAILADMNRVIMNVSSDLFGHDNIFACFSQKSGVTITYYVCAMPIKKRVPDASQFLNSHKKDTPTNDVIDKYDNAFAEVIHDFTPVHAKVELTPEEKGYQPALMKYALHKEKKSDYMAMQYIVSDNTSQIQTVTPFDKINQMVNETIEYFTLGPERTTFRQSQNGKIDPDTFFSILIEYIKRTWPNLPDNDFQYMMNKFRQWAYGMYVLEPLINDDDVSDIMVVRPDDIRVKVKNKRYTSNVRFINETDYYMFIVGLAARNQLDLENKAIHVFSDIKTNPKFRMRMNLVTDYITSDGIPYYHIRKIAKQKRDFNYLLENNMLDETIMNYLIDRARYGPGMIFTGKGASGKTTLMNALLDKIPFDKSGLVSQESSELFSNVHPHLLFEEIRTENPRMTYRLEHLARNGLLTDLDYFIIGEIKGAEAADFMMAADTGHKCWCSVHAPTAFEAMDKLSDYVMGATRYDFNTVNKMLSHLGTIVFMKDFQVCEIVELRGWDEANHKLVYEPIYLRPGVEHASFMAA